MIYDGLDMTQINNGLEQTSACASSIAYDKANGLVFVSYMTGMPKRYGEASGKICLSVFPAGQPHNIRHRVLVDLVEKSRGLLCNAIYMIADKKVRILFTNHSGQNVMYSEDIDPSNTAPATSYSVDYDYKTDTISEITQIFFRTKDGDKPLTTDVYNTYLTENGHEINNAWPLIINKVTSYSGELYTAITVDDYAFGYAILCKIEENVLIPFAICPEKMNYEFRYFINDDGIFGAFRAAPDNDETGHGGYTYSKDGGKTWNTTIYEDGVQSRPDILEYCGKPLYIYNYRSKKSSENFPRLHHTRNAIKFIYDGKVILDLFSKHGFVEYDTLNICGELYMTTSNSPQTLATQNGHSLEQAKEAIQWIKFGYLLDENLCE